ncbi:hypothetical protein L1887_35878 [Cichorium endivia]|nr:hypothetical protein L1887_35878 [Cichorium endivia]
MCKNNNSFAGFEAVLGNFTYGIKYATLRKQKKKERFPASRPLLSIFHPVSSRRPSEQQPLPPEKPNAAAAGAASASADCLPDLYSCFLLNLVSILLKRV